MTHHNHPKSIVYLINSWYYTFMGLYKFIICICHYSIIQTIFTALKILCVLLYSLSHSYSDNYWYFYCCHILVSSSSSQGISLKRWAVSGENDAASDSRYATACLFQASGSLLCFFKSIRSEVWHFQFPLTQIIISLLPFKQSSCFSNSLRIVFTGDYIVTHAYVWAAYHIPQFISYLSKSCLPLVS